MIDIRKQDKIDIVTFSVEKINALITDEIREVVSKVFDTAHSRVIIDLQGVSYIDSSGFGCFLSIMKSARNNYGILKFANPEPAIMDLFKMLQLNTVFQIYDEVDDCIRSF